MTAQLLDELRSAGGDDALTGEMAALALEAGRAIMAIYDGGITVEVKDDESPVTEADRAGEKIIVSGLKQVFPAIPIVAEEAISQGHVPGDLGVQFFLVDPLDGTKEFIKRRGDFTVNIALVRDGAPVAGVVYAPARGELYVGFGHHAWLAQIDDEGAISTSRSITVRQCSLAPCIVASRSHRTTETDNFISRYADAEIVSVGSSLKFCLLAAGIADIYPRFGRTMEWDTAAGDAVLRAAGGTTILPDGGAFAYGKRNQSDDCDFANPHFIAYGKMLRDDLGNL